MTFIEILLENSKIKEARLLNSARKAALNPEIGITIQSKAAFHVIKDCANITINYLPLYVFGSYTNPFEELQGKFTRADIQNFITLTEGNFVCKQLLDVILARGNRENRIEEQKVTENRSDIESGDPYGDYGAKVDVEFCISVTPITDTLCNLFNAK